MLRSLQIALALGLIALTPATTFSDSAKLQQREAVDDRHEQRRIIEKLRYMLHSVKQPNVCVPPQEVLALEKCIRDRESAYKTKQPVRPIKP